MSEKSISRLDPKVVRRQLLKDIEWVKAVSKEGETGWIRMANSAWLIRKNRWWQKWKNPETHKLFHSFNDWMENDCGQARSSIYNLLDIKDNLKLPAKTLEMLGRSRCYELAKLARHRPKMLPKIVEKIRKNPSIPHVEVKQIVTDALAGRTGDRHVLVEFSVKREDIADVNKALLVAQAIEPVERPESQGGKGVHFMSILQEYLGLPEVEKVVKELEKSGALDVSNFKVEK